jgi:hypothetical protein
LLFAAAWGEVKRRKGSKKQFFQAKNNTFYHLIVIALFFEGF